MSLLHRALLAVLAATISPAALADVSVGTSFDFESETTEGWGGGAIPTNIADGGPAGAGDAFLQIGGGARLAVFNTDLSGDLDPDVFEVQVDLLRPVEESGLEIRLVLFGPGSGQGADRWTSTDSVLVPGNGLWDTYTFSVLEEDLTQVRGSQPYSALVDDVDRIMFRYDPGTPSENGAFVTGTLGLDNILIAGVTGDPLADFNGDGAVDLLDLDILGSNFGLSPATAQQGDANGDNVVDLLDLDILGQEFGSGASSEALPEPTAGLLALMGLAAAALRRRSA